MFISLTRLLAVVTLVAATSAQAQIITLFGEDAASDGSWIYNAVTSTLSGPDEAGNVLFGAPDATSVLGSNFLTLMANASIVPPGGSFFSIALFDSENDSVVVDFLWSDFVGGATVSNPIVDADPGFNFANIAGWNLVSGASNSNISITLTKLEATAIPEPSILGLLVPAAALGLMVRRRFLKA